MLKVEQGNAGLWYVTSDVIPGLLVAGDTQKSALEQVGQALADIQAAMDDASSAPAPSSREPVIGLPTEARKIADEIMMNFRVGADHHFSNAEAMMIERICHEVATRSAAMTSKAIADIAAERDRQINAEGWSAEHDDEHKNGEMASAAGAYCQSAARPLLYRQTPGTAWTIPMCWPLQWAKLWWKPRNPRADLVRAGALIAAEIDRLDRIDALARNDRGSQER